MKIRKKLSFGLRVLINKEPENWATQTQYNTLGSGKKEIFLSKKVVKKHLSEPVRLLK